MPDTAGFIWMSTNRGLFKARTEDMIKAFETDRAGVYYHYFGRNDGLDMTELNGGCAPCALQLKNGSLSFPSMDGLVWVDPIHAYPLLPDGPIYLDEIRADGMPIRETELAAKPVPPKTKNLYIRLGFSAWCNTENVYIDYQLDDSTKWIGLNETDGYTIRISNLTPGKHFLRLRKRNGFGNDNFTYKTLSFQMGRRWFQYPAFYLACIGLLLLSVMLFSRYQNRRLLRRQRILEELIARKTNDLQEQNALLEKNNRINFRLISIISHDIVTPLKFLTVAGRGLKEKKGQLSNEIQEETIQEITDTAQELQLLSTNILNWIKYQSENQKLLPERINPHEITQQVFGILAPLTKEKNLKLVNQIQEKLHITQYAEPIRVLIYNLVSNAIRYSDHGEIAVSLTKMKNEYLLSVSDQGIGMSKEKIDNLLYDTPPVREKSAIIRSGHGLGYLIIRDLVRWIGGSLDIASSPGKGTTIRISFRQAGREATDIK
jgi:signal transduction histidine kinase